MRILHVTNYMYPHIGGIEQTTRDIINSLPNTTEQRVICFNDGKRNVADLVDDVAVTRCGTIIKASSQAISFKFGGLLKRTFKEYRPDIVIFHYPNPFQAHYLLKCLKRYKSCKLIVWWHLDITKQKILGKLFKGQSLKLLRRASKIVATSPNYIEGSPFLSKFKDKCVVIPSCINERRLICSDETKEKAQLIRQINEEKTVCFAVGRHVEYKGFTYLIKVAKLLDDNYKIYIGGEGKLTNRLRDEAKGVANIEFLGKLSDEDLKAYMLACDIYCFSSITKNEAFGLALAEAMYFGKPTVTFTIPGSGVNYVSLNGVTGIEVENCSVEEYTKAIVELGINKVLREKYANAAAKRANDLFLEKQFKEHVINLIDEVEINN